MSTGFLLFLTALRIGYYREGTKRLSDISDPATVFLKIICNGKRVKIPFVYKLIETSLRQIALIQSKIMSQLVQKSGVNFVAKLLFIAFRKIPEVFEEYNDLRR